tara:strand:- start:42 stop:257 length:216 start_codon:yes stop_codon:yes gene_type:complete
MGHDNGLNNHTHEEKVMKIYKQEQTIRAYDKAILTWALTDDGPAHTSKVKNKTITHWQPKKWLLTNVEYRA